MESANKVHHFDIELAEELSIESAVLYANLSFWIKKNKANNKHLHNGKYWTYNSISAFSELFPYMTKHKITRALDDLESKGYLETGNFNKSSYDRTKWYACKPELDIAKIGNGDRENQEPIPYNKPDSKPYIYSEKDFLIDWTKCRKAYLNLPTYIAKLEIFEALNFSKATTIFTREQIQSAMKGLFLQEVISFSSMVTKPNHFLERVEQYYMAYESKDFKQYGSKKAQE